MNMKFLRNEEEYQENPVEMYLTEILMRLREDAGSFSDLLDIVTDLYKKAEPEISLVQVPQFLKLVVFFKHLTDFENENFEVVQDFAAYLRSHYTGFYINDMPDANIYYLDHPDFANEYPDFKYEPVQE